MLDALPLEVRSELKEAVESLEGDRIAAAIARTAAFDGALQQALEQLADQLNYPAILSEIDGTEEGPT
jgi:multidrug efflux pump subunit AcrA (membrane-fusion protein)